MSSPKHNLRNQLDRATHAYQSASYPGNLALDVLGPAVTVKRRSFAPLAIAAALALGIGAGIFGQRLLQNTSTGSGSVAISTQSNTESNPSTNGIIELPPVKPTMPKTAVATTDTPAGNGAFTVVPTSESFADQDVSVVPDLGSLETASTETTASGQKTAKAAVAFVPMSLMLLSASEYGEQEQAAKKTKAESSNQTSTAEERS